MPTTFQQRVYDAVRAVPRGRVTTYKHLARHLHCRAYRAVGQALKNNPYAPRVPCHRVIASDLTIGGFKGKRTGKALSEKKSLLKKEGVIFQNGKLLDKKRLFEY